MIVLVYCILLLDICVLPGPMWYISYLYDLSVRFRDKVTKEH